MTVITFPTGCRDGLAADEVETLRRLVFRTNPSASIAVEVDETGGHHWFDADTDTPLLSANRENGVIVIWDSPDERRGPEPDRIIKGELEAALGKSLRG